MHANESWTRHFPFQRSKVLIFITFFFTFKIEIELIKLTGALNRNGVKCLSAITVVTFHQLVAVQNLNFESNVPAFFLLFPRVRAAV